MGLVLSLSRDIKIPVKCPGCNRKHNVSLEDIAREITIPCECGKNLRLYDKGKNTEDISRKLDEIDRLVKEIGGRVSIR